MAGSWIEQHQSMDHITIGQSPRQCRSTGKDHTKLPGPDKWLCQPPTVLDAWIFPKQSHFPPSVFHAVKRNSFFFFSSFFFSSLFSQFSHFPLALLIYFSFISRISAYLNVPSPIYIRAGLFHLVRWLVVYRMLIHLLNCVHLEMTDVGLINQNWLMFRLSFCIVLDRHILVELFREFWDGFIKFN